MIVEGCIYLDFYCLFFYLQSHLHFSRQFLQENLTCLFVEISFSRILNWRKYNFYTFLKVISIFVSLISDIMVLIILLNIFITICCLFICRKCIAKSVFIDGVNLISNWCASLSWNMVIHWLHFIVDIADCSKNKQILFFTWIEVVQKVISNKMTLPCL